MIHFARWMVPGNGKPLADARQRPPVQHKKPPRKPQYPQAEDIWFLETSGRRKLKAREACSIESACLHNSNYTVHLLSVGNINSSYCPYHRVLSKLPNFRSAALSASTELAGTPLSHLYAKGGPLHRSPFFTEHLSDFLRYAVIWKRGGVYLDTDVIVLRSLKGLQNSIVYEVDGRHVANGLLFFSKNHPVIGAIMLTCSRQYQAGWWSTCGPWLTSHLPNLPEISRFVNFLPSWTFLKSKFDDWRWFFDPTKAQSLLRVVNSSYGAHFWNRVSKHTIVMTGSGSAMDLLARAHCPAVYSLASSVGYL
ncbi:lactosylceramide 4-alpha-galactosyltransferase-like [Rhipicephalus sanguineus]|uniref:lactosylceramide 4-alpha-galactosyltransferase-like n=1 Tax=Rhipicephalus sanguineus TaxID=34632 RepID=UPI0018962E67|nr:lactosylceramide 4-alpha-galactosyltransferase-like [Rhipicephalus sanguineus]